MKELVIDTRSLVPAVRIILSQLREPTTGLIVWEARLPFTQVKAHGFSVDECLINLNRQSNFQYEPPPAVSLN